MSWHSYFQQYWSVRKCAWTFSQSCWKKWRHLALWNHASLTAFASAPVVAVDCTFKITPLLFYQVKSIRKSIASFLASFLSRLLFSSAIQEASGFLACGASCLTRSGQVMSGCTAWLSDALRTSIMGRRLGSISSGTSSTSLLTLRITWDFHFKCFGVLQLLLDVSFTSGKINNSE